MDPTFLFKYVKWLDPIFLYYFTAINLVYTIVLAVACLRVYSRRKELRVEDFTQLLHSESLPEVTFIVPIYNRSSKAGATIQNILNLSYRYKQIILVNDGSEDDSMEVLKKTYKLEKTPLFFKQNLPTKPVKQVYRSLLENEIIVIDKEHGKKFDTVNTGINACTNPFFIIVDDDTFIDDQGFEALIRPILSDPKTVAIGATIRIKNGCTLKYNRIDSTRFPKTFLTAMQSLEYLRSFLMRQGWDHFGGNVVISGAFSIFPTKLIIEVGGFCPSVAEDMEIIIRLHHIMKAKKLPYKITYIPDPVAWTEAPTSIKRLARQRANWHRGMMEAIWYHKEMCLSPKYGMMGIFNLPFWIWGEILEPVVEALGYSVIITSWYLGVLNVPFFILLMCISLGFTFIFTIACLFIEELSFKKFTSLRSLCLLMVCSFIENLGYRQMNILWRLIGIKDFFLRFKEIEKETLLVKGFIDKSVKKGTL
jgi:cellulose synthase/poly-beta-1,6-N-acetylglucosamine synthase-like glycosyltransferase